MKTRFPSVLWLVCLMVALAACLENEPAPSAEEVLRQSIQAVDKTKLQSDIAIIDDSLQRKFLSPLKDSENAVRYVLSQAGTGATPTITSDVRVAYRARVLGSNTFFDQSTDARFNLNNLIIGWKTTLPLLKAGSKATLYIPSGFAYGTREVRDNDGILRIPANSNVVFEIELKEVF